MQLLRACAYISQVAFGKRKKWVKDKDRVEQVVVVVVVANGLATFLAFFFALCFAPCCHCEYDVSYGPVFVLRC